MPRCSVLEASWLYSEGAERLDALPRAPTVAAKVRMGATRGHAGLPKDSSQTT